MKYKHQEHPIIIDASHVPDLTVIEPTPSGVKVGASVSLTSLNEFSQKLIQEEPGRLQKGMKRVGLEGCERKR